MIKIIAAKEETNPETQSFPRIMVNDLEDDKLVWAICRNNLGNKIEYMRFNEQNATIQCTDSHHFQDFEGSITIRNDR